MMVKKQDNSERDDPFSFADFSSTTPKHVPSAGHDNKLSSALGVVKDKISATNNNGMPSAYGPFWQGWQWLVGLIASWIIIFLVIFLIEHRHFDAAHLIHFPVIVGHMPYSGGVLATGVLHALFVWSQAHKVLGLFGYLIWFILMIFNSLISAICAMFIHASFGHVLANSISMTLIAIAGRMMNWSFRDLVVRWFMYGTLTVWVTYLAVELLAAFERIGHVGTNAWYNWLWYSVTPIVGASVGIMAVGSFVLMQTIKGLFTSDMRKWLALVIMLVLTLCLSVNVILGITTIKVTNAINIALFMSSSLHALGWLLGVALGLMTHLNRSDQNVGF